MAINQKLNDDVRQLHAQVCGALADPIRILILYMLSENPRSVGDIVKELDLSQPTVSRHLRVLRTHNLVTATREGVNVFYALNDRRVIDALDILRAVMTDQFTRQANLMNQAN